MIVLFELPADVDVDADGNLQVINTSQRTVSVVRNKVAKVRQARRIVENQCGHNTLAGTVGAAGSGRFIAAM